jgi:hypothetical protein
LLLLLAHHLGLHTLLARDDVTRLVRVVHGVEWLCERGKGISAARIIIVSWSFPPFEGSLKFTLIPP